MQVELEKKNSSSLYSQTYQNINLQSLKIQQEDIKVERKKLSLYSPSIIDPIACSQTNYTLLTDDIYKNHKQNKFFIISSF